MKSSTMTNHLHIECEDGKPVVAIKELRVEGPCIISMNGKFIGESNGYSLRRELPVTKESE